MAKKEPKKAAPKAAQSKVRGYKIPGTTAVSVDGEMIKADKEGVFKLTPEQLAVLNAQEPKPQPVS